LGKTLALLHKNCKKYILKMFSNRATNVIVKCCIASVSASLVKKSSVDVNRISNWLKLSVSFR